MEPRLSMQASDVFAGVSSGRRAASVRFRGALLGLAGAAPGTLVLLAVAVLHSTDPARPGDWTLLALLALASLGLGAWIGSALAARAADEPSRRIVEVLRSLAGGNSADRIGGPYAGDVGGEVARAVDAVGDRLTELHEAVARHRILAELSSDFLFRLAPDATFLTVSPSVQRLLGYEPQEMIGRSSYDFVHPDDLSAARQNHDVLLSDGAPSCVLRMRRKSGGYLTMELTPRLRRDPLTSRPSEILGIARDVTERLEHASEVERARRDAVASVRSRSSFLAHMSHDLRTPLNIIIGLSQIIRDQMFGPVGGQRYVDYARDIESSGHDLLDLINDLLDLSKVESGRWELEERAVSVARNVDAVFTMLSDRARTAKVMLDSRMDPKLPLLLADERAVRQAILNVVSSCLKRASGDTALTIDGRLIGGEIVLAAKTPVRPVEARDDYAKGSTDGSVSLALASDLMRLHGGRLTSHVNAGVLTVTITFPAQRSLTAPAGRPVLRIAG
jgi:PAS domain S-box-containing protein